MNSMLNGLFLIENYFGIYWIFGIGRVGRTERMCMAISLVAQLPEKVWYIS